MCLFILFINISLCEVLFLKNEKKIVSEFPLYKGKPFIRCKDVIYYGNMSDPFVVKFEIKEKTQQGDINISNKIIVQLLETITNLSGKKKIVKSSEKNSLYDAVDIANVWLERSLNV